MKSIPEWVEFTAHARSLGLTLVTSNSAEFKRVKGLAIENWTIAVRRGR